MVDIDFKFLEFWTYYSSKGDIEKDLNKEWCFSEIFNGESWMHNTYELYIYRYGYKKGADNNCLITKRQLIKHIEEIKKFHDFEYTLTSIPGGYKLQFSLACELMWHKIILSWLRYSYEFPYNVTLYEAFRVCKHKDFKDLSMLNLFNLIGASLNCSKHGTSIHGIGRLYEFKKLISYDTFVEYVNEEIEYNNYGEINGIIPVKEDIDVRFEYLKPSLNYRINHTDYWKDFKSFKERLNIYKHNLEILKNK